MHSNLRFLLIVLAVSNAPVVLAQETEPMTIDEFRQELNETSRGFDRLERRGERTSRGELESRDPSLQRAPNSPWPPVDPALSAENWMSIISEAPETSTAALLEGLKEVDLDVWSSVGLRVDSQSESNTIAMISDAMAKQGWKHSPTSEFRLEVALRLVTYTLSRNGAPIEERPNVLRIDVSLEVPARVLRKDGPHHGHLMLGQSTAQWVGSKKPTTELLRTSIDLALNRLVADASSASRSVGTSESPWAAWCKSGDPSERLDQFKASHRAKRDELDSAIDLVFGLSGVDAKATGYEGAHKYFKYLQGISSEQVWSKHFRTSGRSMNVQNAPILKHRVLLNGYEQEGRSRVAWSASTSLLERNALAVIGGSWTLLEGVTFVDTFATGLLTAKELPAEFQSEYPQCWTRLDSWLGKPSPEEMELHKDAPAILAFLSERERVAVPKGVAAQLANRIAFTIEASQIPTTQTNKWFRTIDGQATFRLDSFGDARSAELVPRNIQDKVRAAIETVEWEDPIALHAFETPFHFKNGVDRTILPEAFVKRLSRPRPSGAGALATEQVITGADLAFDLVRYYAPRAQENEMRNVLRGPEVNRRLQEIKIIEANYLPKAGDPKDHRVIQWFWYLEEPQDWAELRAKLPAKLPFKRIAEACEGAPDRLEVAEKLVDKAIEAAGD